MTTYKISVFRARGGTLLFTATIQSYRKAKAMLMEFVAACDPEEHAWTIMRMKPIPHGIDSKEVAHGAFVGGQRM